MITALAAAAALGWILAAGLAGLWWGERGRRTDVQHQAGVLREEQRATVVEPDPDPEQLVSELVNQDGREELVRDIMDETGCSKKVAEEEATRILEQASRLGGEVAGW